MCKFKAGDRVRHVDGSYFSNGNKIVTIERVAHGQYFFKETRTDWRASRADAALELAEDTSKHHKHHDLIIAWAKGAVIERRRSSGNWGSTCSPLWDSSAEYRIKPEKSESELEKESIIAEMEALKQRLDKLEV